MNRAASILAAAVLPVLSTSALAQDKVTYQDHVLPIFRNGCLNCHNADKKKADLDLSTFAGAMAGGGSGKAVEPGNPDGSLLYRLVTHAEEPNMPPKGGKLPEKDLNTIKSWIAGGLLETSSSAALASNKPKLDLAVAVTGAGKPDGPPPMPADLLLEPVVHTPRPGAVSAMAASPWAPLVAVGGQNQVLLYDAKTTDLLGVLPFPDGQPNVLRFARSGKLLLAGGGQGARSGMVALYDVITGNRITQLGDEHDAVLAADITADQSLVALGGPSRVVKVFDVATGAAVKQIKKHTDWVTAIAYSPDAVLLATGDRAGNLHVWETRSGNAFYTLAGHNGAITELSYRGDSNVLASASEDGTIRLWDMYAGKQIKEIKPAHADGVLSLHFAHDGRLVSCGRDRKVKLWKPDGSPIKESEPFADIVLRCALAGEDGALAVAGDWTGEIRVLGAADAKKLGTLDVNPPPLATRLALAEKHFADAKASHDKLAAELARLEDESRRSTTALETTKQAAATATRLASRAAAEAAAATGEHVKASDDLKAAEASLAKAKADAERFAQAKTQAIAARDAVAASHRAASEAAARAQAHADTALEVASRLDVLRMIAPTPFNDGAVTLAQESSQRQREQADAASAAVEPLAQQLQPLVDAVAKADAEAAAAPDAIAAAQRLIEQRRAARDQAASQVPAATASAARAQADAEAASKALTAKTAAAEASAQAVAKARPAADAAAAKLAAAQRELAKWRAATVNVALLAAKKDLADAEANHAKLADAAKQAHAALAKATADVAAMERAIADSPALIASLTQRVATAKAAHALAGQSAELLAAAPAEGDALAKASPDVAAQLQSAAGAAADAAAEAARRAAAAHAAAEAALAKEQSAAPARPAELAKLKQSADDAADAAARHKTAADAAAQAVTPAKARVDQLAAEYARLRPS